MENEVTAVASSFDTLVAIRTAKNGKETTRCILDIAITGNKVERASLSHAIAEEFWFVKADIRPFIATLNRVFPTLAKTIDERNKMAAQFVLDNPGSKLTAINLKAPKKLDVLAMFVVAKGLTGADKGAKAATIATFQHLADMEDALALAKAERAKAFQLANEVKEVATS